MKEEQPNLFDIESAVFARHQSGIRAALAEFQKKHGILTHCAEDLKGDAGRWLAILPKDKHKGLDVGSIMAEECRLYDEGGLTGYGSTRREAIKDLCAKQGIEFP
jgi:hypothetical protein